MLTQREICKRTNLKPRQIDHLVRNYVIPPKLVKRYGKGTPRKFKPEAVEVIKDWKLKRGIK